MRTAARTTPASSSAPRSDDYIDLQVFPFAGTLDQLIQAQDRKPGLTSDVPTEKVKDLTVAGSAARWFLTTVPPDKQAMFQQGQPAAMFFTDDIKGDYERIKARGAEFTMAPTEVTGSTIAQLPDTCGNLLQITQLARW